MEFSVADADPILVRRSDLLLTSFGHQLAVFVLDGATLWAMLRGLGVDARLPAVFSSFIVSSLARTLGILPGGLGTFEAASVATLALVGTPVAAALTATLLFRGLSFWLPLLPSVIMARREAR
jgi:Mg2+-importing ATPase